MVETTAGGVDVGLFTGLTIIESRTNIVCQKSTGYFVPASTLAQLGKCF